MIRNRIAHEGQIKLDDGRKFADQLVPVSSAKRLHQAMAGSLLTIVPDATQML